MRVVICDKCEKRIKGANVGKKWLTLEYDGYFFVIKVTGIADKAMAHYDLCQDCLIELIKKTEQGGTE